MPCNVLVVLFFFSVFLTTCYCQYHPNNNNIVINDRIYLNDIIDETILDIRSAVKKFGFDPAKVPAVLHNLNVTILSTRQTIHLNLTNGILNGISNFTRAGNFYLKFLPSTIRLHGKVYIDYVYGNFSYTFSTRLYGDSGILNISIENVTAILEIDYRLDQLRILNPKLKIKHIGRITIDMKSEAKLIWLTNIITKVALPLLKNETIIISEKVFLKTIQNSINYANNNMKDIILQSIIRIITALWNGDFNRSYRHRK